MLHKALSAGIRDVDTLQGIVTGYAAAFNILDDDQDIILPGAFAKTLTEQGPLSKQPRVKFLYQHDATKLLGVPSVLREDPYGLYFEVRLAQTTLAQDVLALYAAHILTEHSIGYEVVEATWDRAKGARLLQQLKLYEFSCVTWGANSQTPVVSVKSLTHPTDLASMADRAQRLDALLHNGTLRSDALCATLDRELKSLHAALAPADTARQPYTIQGVIDSMTALADKLATKGATGKTSWPLGARNAAWDNGAAHQRIVAWATKADDTIDTAKMKSVHFYSPDGDDAQDVSKYKMLFCDVESGDIKAMPRAIFACAGAHGVDGTTGISASDKAKIKAKITTLYHRMSDEFDDDTLVSPFETAEKGTTMKRQVKGSGGDIAVADDGTHDPYTGTHEHSHKAMGSQGDDDMHAHEHTHDGDAKHNHDHEKAIAPKATPRRQVIKTPDGRTMRKALDFATALTIVSADDTLQDEWGDSFQALVNALHSVMVQAYYANMGMMGDDAFDGQAAAETVLSQFSDAMTDLVKRSLAADFHPALDDDGDSFFDPDGPNAVDDDDDDWDDDYKSRRKPHPMPDAPAPLKKAGRSISEGNRKVITEALDGMSEAMKAMKSHHGAIADLMTKTDPDHVRQDEDSTQGDDDTANGGTNPNKSRYAPRRTADQAGTTHQGWNLSEIDSDLDALRRKGRKA